MTASKLPCAVLWDLDGTLIDSGDLHWVAWEEAIRAAGYPFDRDHFVSRFGQRNELLLRSFLGPAATPARIREISDDKERRYRAQVAAGRLRLLPGVTEWLAALAAAGWRQAIASSAPRANIAAALHALGLTSYFDATVADEDVTHGKPDPEVFLLAAERLATPPARCVVVEDSPFGIEGARRAGMKAIGVGPQFGSLPADLTVVALTDLPVDAFVRLLADGLRQ